MGGCMGRFGSRGLGLTVSVLSLLGVVGCGGSKAGAPLFPGQITLTPTTTASMVLGGTLNFVASAHTASGTNLNTPISYTSSDTSILNLTPGGIACAGHWDIAFTTCTPGNVGVALVTASALGASSVPTYVFVHPQVDNISVTGVLLTGLPPQEPCLSQTQSMTIQAHAYSQGTDVTQSVGPFTWTASNSGVVTLVPLTNTTYKFPTNQATAIAASPGTTYIYATADGVTSTSFQQPQYSNAQGGTSPLLDFFATCAISNISVELGFAGSGQTSFNITKSSTTSEVAVATVTDIMGNTSLSNTTGNLVLTKMPLTWTSSQPQVITVPAGCTQSCTLTIASPGSATVTASCSPPTCNAGFPEIPQTLSTPAQVQACTTFFQSEFPLFAGCQQLIPVPVYSSSVFVNPSAPPVQLAPNAAISGVISGTPAATSVFAASTGCSQQSPIDCNSSAYFLSTAKASPGNQNPLPVSPNSFLFDPTGARVYMGSNFGAASVNPANFGTSNSPFTMLGTVTGNILAASNNGTISAFSDTIHTPNQVYIVNSSSASSASATALTIPSATLAAFSPDGLKTFIAGGIGGNSLYIYSPLQALQQPSTANPQLTLSGPATAIGFSPNGAFTFVAESASNTTAPNLTAFANCNNQVAATQPLPANPILMKVLPNVHIDGRDSIGNPIPDGVHVAVLDATGFDIVTWTISPPATVGTLCPQSLNFLSLQRVELGQGTLQPLNFFASADGTQLYVVNLNSSTIPIYNFIAGAVVGGIELVGNATPLSADISVDDSTILISGSDGMLHEVSAELGGSDLVQLAFPNLPNYFNAFCAYSPSPSICTLNVALAKP
jgi:hypothetical protein